MEDQESTPTFTPDRSNQDHYKIIDYSNKNRTIHLHGKLVDGGNERDSSKFAMLENVIPSDDEEAQRFNPIDHVEVKNDDLITTNALTIACWVKFNGESMLSSTIVGSNDNNNRCAFIVNSNESAGEDDVTGQLGYTWGNYLQSTSNEGKNWSKPDYMFDTTIPKEKWTWLVLMLYPSGISRLFVDNIYTASYDEGFVRESKTLRNLEVGRFSGMVDNVFLFSDNIDYGGVSIGMPATSELEYLYNTSRLNPTEATQPTVERIEQPSYGGVNFHYMQSETYTEAFGLYESRTESKLLAGQTLGQAIRSQTQESLNEQKYTVTGGTNNGIRTFADGKFRTFKGEIREME
tara:strand:- start:1220 stop:2263 length:1044 start_codon:yes stop_codon:yes gene_type:complete